MSYLARESSHAFTLFDSGDYESDAIDMSNYVGGAVLIPSGWINSNLGFKISDTLAGTYYPLRNEYGVPVQIVSMSGGLGFGPGWYELPDEIFPVKFVKLWSKSTTSTNEGNINQGSQTVKLLLKS